MSSRSCHSWWRNYFQNVRLSVKDGIRYLWPCVLSTFSLHHGNFVVSWSRCVSRIYLRGGDDGLVGSGGNFTGVDGSLRPYSSQPWESIHICIISFFRNLQFTVYDINTPDQRLDWVWWLTGRCSSLLWQILPIQMMEECFFFEKTSNNQSSHDSSTLLTQKKDGLLHETTLSRSIAVREIIRFKSYIGVR